MRRLGVIVALGALLGMFGGVVTASPALARGPKWQFLPAGTFILPADFCGFEIRQTSPADKEYAKVLKSSDGSMITLVTGTLKTSFTNLSTGKTITINESGPSKTTVFPDGSITVFSHGHTGLLLPPPVAQQLGMPVLSLSAGRLTFRIAPDGTVSLSLQGHVLLDICAALS
jgi:hypothetical protein